MKFWIISLFAGIIVTTIFIVRFTVRGLKNQSKPRPVRTIGDIELEPLNEFQELPFPNITKEPIIPGESFTVSVGGKEILFEPVTADELQPQKYN